MLGRARLARVFSLFSVLCALLVADRLRADGQFNLTTYNVHSLPEIKVMGIPIIGNGKNLKTIADRVCDLEILLIQEDFWQPELASLGDCYDDILLAPRDLSLKPKDFIRQMTKRDDRKRLQSGLSIFSKHNILSHTQIPWQVCSGYTSNANDCLSWKGFTHTVIELEPGVVVDVYNLHHDAGKDGTDRDARFAQTKQLVAHIKKQSKNNMLIVAGDFNAMTEEPGLNYFRRSLPIREVCPTLKCDDMRIDKVFFRSGNVAKLIPRHIQVYKPTRELSDHEAIYVDFEWMNYPGLD